MHIKNSGSSFYIVVHMVRFENLGSIAYRVVFSRSSSYFNRTSVLIYACQKWNISMTRPWMDMIWHHIHVMVDFFRVFRALNSVLLEALSCLLTRGKQWLIHHKTELVPPSDYITVVQFTLNVPSALCSVKYLEYHFLVIHYCFEMTASD